MSRRPAWRAPLPRHPMPRADRDLVGTGWWYRDLRSDADGGLRRWRLAQLSSLSLGLTLLGGCAELQGFGWEESVSDEGPPVPMDALQAQQERGWSVGQETRPLTFPGATPLDAAGSQSWQRELPNLTHLLEPGQAPLLPYYVPTLFQVMASPSGSGLRALVQPIDTPAMAASYQRGRGLLALFQAGGWPTDIAVVLDLPGPESIAAAAALADRFDPVFAFDNWPHPAGVVPSHLTLAAALFHLPRFEASKAHRLQPAPPVFVLDSARLNPYTDEQGQFDNRYLAKLPGGEALRQLGIAHVLYVSRSGQRPQELDDLNDAFVALAQTGIDVRLLPLAAFEAPPSDDPNALSFSDQGEIPPYALGGDPRAQLWFWDWYGWSCPAWTTHGARWPSPLSPPLRLIPDWSYRPHPRPTYFSNRNGSAGIHLGGLFHSLGRIWLPAPRGWRSGSLGRWHGSFVS